MLIDFQVKYHGRICLRTLGLFLIQQFPDAMKIKLSDKSLCEMPEFGLKAESYNFFLLIISLITSCSRFNVL